MTIPQDILGTLPDVLHVADTGRTVRREDLHRLERDELRQLWFDHHYTTGDEEPHTAPRWPFRGDDFFFVDPTPPGPAPMPLAELVSLGLTDAELFAEHAAYYPDPAVAPHHHADEDAPGTQALRRRVYDEVTAAWYSDPPMRRRHP